FSHVFSAKPKEAVNCLFSLKRLQSLPQTFATFASNVCNLCLKRLQSLPQTFAVKRRLFVESLPLMFFC
ncbi:MAG: hypothetical protein PUD84_09850, partial [Paraprevotella sp.]|nr:hypothetical protein [Paraprevotella sp.]